MQDRLEQTVANELASGAPGTLALGGQTYLVGQPTDADFMSLKKYLRGVWQRLHANPLAAVADGLQGLPPHLQELAIREAVKLKAGNNEPTSEALQETLMRPEGCAFWAWLLIRKQHPDVTHARLVGLVTEQNVDDVLAGLFEASGMRAVDPNSRGATGSRK